MRPLGAALVARFEAHALGHGCSVLYLETFSFQAPRLYASLGYTVAHESAHFPHGIRRFLMEKTLSAG